VKRKIEEVLFVVYCKTKRLILILEIITNTPLHYAVCNRDYQLVSYLLEYKADPNMGEGETFLHKLTYDKDISMFDKFSFTGSDNLNCVKQLLVAKSDLTRRNDKGQTPLMSVYLLGKLLLFETFIEIWFQDNDIK